MSKQQYLEQLFDTMEQLRKLMEGRAQESHEERFATIMQFLALKFLRTSQDRTIGELADHLMLSKSSATQLIERLVKAGFVERIDDPEDRRIVRLRITPRGEQLLANMKQRYVDKMTALLSKIPDEDLRELVRIHRELIETIQKEQRG